MARNNDKLVWNKLNVSGNAKLAGLHAEYEKARAAANKSAKALTDALVAQISAKVPVPATHEIVISTRFGLAYAVKEKSEKSGSASTDGLSL